MLLGFVLCCVWGCCFKVLLFLIAAVDPSECVRVESGSVCNMSVSHCSDSLIPEVRSVVWGMMSAVVDWVVTSCHSVDC